MEQREEHLMQNSRRKVQASHEVLEGAKCLSAVRVRWCVGAVDVLCPNKGRIATTYTKVTQHDEF